MVPKLLTLALEYHRMPLRFGHLTDPTAPLPDAFETWLIEAGSALAPRNIGQTAASLGISRDEARSIFLFFLRQTLLFPQADLYRVLGLSRRCTAQAVKQHRCLLVRLFHPDRTPQGDERGVALTARINAAYRILRDPQARRRYDTLLPPQTGAGPAMADEWDFFRPRAQFIALPRDARSTPEQSVQTRSIWLSTAAFFALAALLSILVREPDRPSLRINQELASSNAIGPSFLRGNYAADTHGEEQREMVRIVGGGQAENARHSSTVASPAIEHLAHMTNQTRDTGGSEVVKNHQSSRVSTATPLEPILAPRNPPLAQ